MSVQGVCHGLHGQIGMSTLPCQYLAQISLGNIGATHVVSEESGPKVFAANTCENPDKMRIELLG